MKYTPGPWLIVYAHERRVCAHRCRVCNRVLHEGDRAWMARIAPKVTKAIHESCGGAMVGGGEYTGAELLGVQALLYAHPMMLEAEALSIARVAIANAEEVAA